MWTETQNTQDTTKSVRSPRQWQPLWPPRPPPRVQEVHLQNNQHHQLGCRDAHHRQTVERCPQATPRRRFHRADLLVCWMIAEEAEGRTLGQHPDEGNCRHSTSRCLPFFTATVQVLTAESERDECATHGEHMENTCRGNRFVPNVFAPHSTNCPQVRSSSASSGFLPLFFGRAVRASCKLASSSSLKRSPAVESATSLRAATSLSGNGKQTERQKDRKQESERSRKKNTGKRKKQKGK